MSSPRVPWRNKAVVAALAAAMLAGPGVAQAAPQTAPVAGERAAAATITWSLVRAGNPTTDQQNAYNLITTAMNAAVSRYNSLSDLGVLALYERRTEDALHLYKESLELAVRDSNHVLVAYGLANLAYTCRLFCTGCADLGDDFADLADRTDHFFHGAACQVNLLRAFAHGFYAGADQGLDFLGGFCAAACQ
jgi:hypothetical protein